MHIFNIMLGKGKGGIEQAALDYAEAIALAGHQVTNVFAPDSWALQASGIGGQDSGSKPRTTPLPQLGAWDIFAARRLKKLAHAHSADLLLCHGNRAMALAHRACKGRLPIVGIAHNYNTKRFGRLDAALTITQDLRNKLIKQGLAPNSVFHIPNMVRLPEAPPTRPVFRTPPVIGTMGRFVKKKGFNLYIEALALLKERGIAFEAQLGGDGEEKAALQAQSDAANIPLTFTGWVEDKKAFFDGIDIFALPSHHEPFGIVLIEAMAAGLPCISTASEGPREILEGGDHGLLTHLGDAKALADAMELFIANHSTAQEMGHNGYLHTAEHYSLPAISQQLDKALRATLDAHQKRHT